MERRPGLNVVGLSLVVNVSIRATTQYTSAILCTKKWSPSINKLGMDHGELN